MRHVVAHRPSQGGGGQVLQRLPVVGHHAREAVEQAGQHAQQRGFARAVEAGEAHVLAGPDGQRQRLHGRLGGVRVNVAEPVQGHRQARPIGGQGAAGGRQRQDRQVQHVPDFVERGQGVVHHVELEQHLFYGVDDEQDDNFGRHELADVELLAE